MKHRSETYSDIFKLKHKQTGENAIVLKPKQKYLWAEAGHPNSKLCASQATKNGLVDRSAEPEGAHWDGKMVKKMEPRNETYSDIIITLKHVWKGENATDCEHRNRILCVVTQVMQSANCARGRQLKMCWWINFGCWCAPSKTNLEWETNHYVLLSALYAIHHVNESVFWGRSCNEQIVCQPGC